MYNILINEELSLLIEDVYYVEVNESKGTVKFFGADDSIKALFKLQEIKGFYEMP